MLHQIPGLSNKSKRKFTFIHGARNNSLERQGEAEEKLKDGGCPQTQFSFSMESVARWED